MDYIAFEIIFSSKQMFENNPLLKYYVATVKSVLLNLTFPSQKFTLYSWYPVDIDFIAWNKEDRYITAKSQTSNMTQGVTGTFEYFFPQLRHGCFCGATQKSEQNFKQVSLFPK